MSGSATNNVAKIQWDQLLRAPKQQLRHDIEDIVAGLSERIKERDEGIKARDAQITRLTLELKLREEQLRLARLEKYGPKGEQLSAQQIQLLNLEPGVQAAEVENEAALPQSDKELEIEADARKKTKVQGPHAPRYIKAHPGRNALPAHLPRQEVIIACEEGAGGELIGYDEKEELVIKAAEFYVQVIKREKRRVSCDGRSTILSAPMPARIVEKGQLGNSVSVELLVSKYCDHQPIYRQLKSWQRDYSIKLDDDQALRAVMSAGGLLQPLARRIGAELKVGELIQADETRVPVLQKDGKGRNDTAWFWQYSRPGGLVYFDYQSSRSRAGPGEYLKDYQGRLQSDGYEVYTPLGKELRSHGGCWAHVRRKFDKARKIAPKEAPCTDSQEMLDRIAELYVIEAEAREQSLKGEARLSLRQQRGVEAKLAAIKAAVIAIRQKILPASQLGNACDYSLSQWEKLKVYAHDGEMEIDNNWCENAMRPVALGRKNWMHLGSQESGPVVAAIMSVIASAQRAGLNVRAYLTDVLERLASPDFKVTRLAELLPANWQPVAASTLPSDEPQRRC